MIVKLLTEHHLEFLSLKGGCTGSSTSIHVKMPHCWRSHAMAHIVQQTWHFMWMLHEFLDFCNGSKPRERHTCKYDWQLSSLHVGAICFEHRFYPPEVTLLYWLTARHAWFAHAKQASPYTCLICFYTPTKLLIQLLIKYKTVLPCALVSLSDFSPPYGYKSHILNWMIQ